MHNTGPRTDPCGTPALLYFFHAATLNLFYKIFSLIYQRTNISDLFSVLPKIKEVHYGIISINDKYFLSPATVCFFLCKFCIRRDLSLFRYITHNLASKTAKFYIVTEIVILNVTAFSHLSV